MSTALTRTAAAAAVFTTAVAARPRPEPLASARFAVSALFFLNGSLTASWVARIPALQSQHGFSHAQLGLALLAMAAGAVVAMPLTGALIARRGSDSPTRVAAFLFCAALPFLALASSLTAFVAALALVGVIHGVLDVAMNAQAVEVERLAPRPIMSSFHALFSAGGLFGAASGAAFAAVEIAPLVHFAAVGVTFAIGAFCVIPLLLPTQPLHRSSGPAPPGRRFTLPSPALLALGALALCTMVGEGAMADWGALYLRDILHAGEGVAAGGYAAFSIAMAAARLGGDRLTTVLGAVRLTRIGGACAAGGLLLALLVPSASIALLGFAGVGLGLATLVPMVFSAAGRLPGFAPGVALSTVTTMGYLGFLAGPPTIGFVAEAIGLRGALGLIVGTSVCTVLLAPVLESGPHTRKSPSRSV